MISIGVDVNVRGLGVAVAVKYEIKELLSNPEFMNYVKRLNFEGYTTRHTVYIAGYIPIFQSFTEYLMPRLEGLIAKYKAEIEVARAVRVNLPTAKVKIPNIADKNLIKQLTTKLVNFEPPELFNRELAWLLLKSQKEWRRRYLFETRRAASRLAALTRRIPQNVTVKLENLQTINPVVVANPKTIRWCYSRIQKIITAALPQTAKIALINPRNTSSLTPCCNAKTIKKQYKTLICKKCQRKWHRDILAAINIAKTKPIKYL